MAYKYQSNSSNDRKLDLKDIAAQLQADGLLSKNNADNLIIPARSHKPSDLHPLVIIAKQGLTSAKPPHGLLDLETLTAWLAEKAGLPYFHIDPLKIDVTAVTSVAKYSYADRNQVLPVSVTHDNEADVLAYNV